MKIFVYGTLMKGEGNHSILSSQSTQFLGEAITRRGFTLYDLGAFPGMVKGGTGAVIGEIYEVTKTTLAHLDYLEGHPQFYRREMIKLQDGMNLQTYILNDAFIQDCTVIKSGDWRKSDLIMK